MSSSKHYDIGLAGGKFELETPTGDWPGTVYGDLVRVHWELIVISRGKRRTVTVG